MDFGGRHLIGSGDSKLFRLARAALLIAPLLGASCKKPAPAAAQPGAADESASPGPSSSANAAMLAGLTGDPDAAAAAASAIAGSADDATKRAAAPLLIATARKMRAPAYRDTLRPQLVEANRVAQVEASPAQVELQVDAYQEEKVAALLKRMGTIGGPEISAYLTEIVEDGSATPRLRKLALLALEDAAHSPLASESAVAQAAAERGKLSSTVLDAPLTWVWPSSSAPARDGKGPVGTVGVGGASVSGGAVANASAVVAGMAAGFRRCYNRGLQEDPTQKGTVRITAKIGKGGEVLGASPSSTGNLSPTVLACVAARTSSAQFSPPDGAARRSSFPCRSRRKSRRRNCERGP